MKHFLWSLSLISVMSVAQAQSNITAANPGTFNNAQYNQYITSTVGGCSPQTLYTSINGAYETSALTTCAANPASSMQRQVDGLSALVDNFSSTSPTIAVFGGAQAEVASAGIWGGNFVAYDNGLATDRMYGIEDDVDVHSSSSTPRGMLITGLWTVQPSRGYALEIAQNNTSFNWPYGIHFDTAATLAPTFNNAALFFGSTSSAVNSASQGIFFQSNAPGSGQFGASLNLLANGNLNVVFPGNSAGALAAPSVRLTPQPFSSLPACASGTEGTQAAITNSTTNTWGTTVTGGGSKHVLAYCDGTNWTVAGK